MTRGAGRLALVAGVLAAFANGCGGGEERSHLNTRNVRLVAVVKGLDNPFFVTMRDGLVASARRHGARLRVAAAPAGLQDTAGQASELESAAADRPACYVVNPINQTNLIQTLARIPEKAPIVNVDSVIGREPAQAVGVEITSYVGTDNAAAGRRGADAMAALVGRGARVAVIAGIPGDAGSGLRTEGFKQGARGRFEVVMTFAADFEREKARLAAEGLLRADPDIDGVFAVNDLMALGVADAVKAAGRRDDVEVIGLDGIRQALAAVRRGALSATVAQYPYTIGQLGVEACLAAVRGEPVPAMIDAPIQLVTSKNVAQAEANFPRPVERFDDPFAQPPEN
ncbi:MAG TPA: substrate-binding domain-containing protein [Solirubrobacteraceae bacterium]|nr:substrate-binding domain-containing protein [Solirubrobacteraceae bacterium]